MAVANHGIFANVRLGLSDFLAFLVRQCRRLIRMDRFKPSYLVRNSLLLLYSNHGNSPCQSYGRAGYPERVFQHTLKFSVSTVIAA